MESGEEVGEEVLLLDAAPLRAHHLLAQAPHLFRGWGGSLACFIHVRLLSMLTPNVEFLKKRFSFWMRHRSASSTCSLRPPTCRETIPVSRNKVAR